MGSVLERNLNLPVTLAESELYEAELPKSHHFERIDLHITGKLTPTGHDATLKEDGILNLVKKVIISGDGITTPKSIDGETIAKRAWLENGVFPKIANPLLTAGSAHAFEMILPVYFKVNRDKQGMSSILCAKGRTSLKLQIQMGAVTDMAAPTEDGSIALSELELVAFGREIVGIPANIAFFLHKEYQPVVRKAFAAGEEQVLAELKAGGALRSLCFKVEDDSGANSNDLLDRISIVITPKDGEARNIRDKISFAQLQENNRKFYGIEMTSLYTTPPIDQTGFAIWLFDEAENFQLGEMIKTGDYDKVEIVADVLDDSVVTITAQELL